MTGMLEAALAGELGIAYGALAMVVNYAAGRGDGRNRVDLDGLVESYCKGMGCVDRIIETLSGGAK